MSCALSAWAEPLFRNPVCEGPRVYEPDSITVSLFGLEKIYELQQFTVLLHVCRDSAEMATSNNELKIMMQAME